MKRLATMVNQLRELVDLLDAARYALHCFDTLPDSLHRIERAIELATPLSHSLWDAAEHDAELAFYDEFFEHDEADEDGT